MTLQPCQTARSRFFLGSNSILVSIIVVQDEIRQLQAYFRQLAAAGTKGETLEALRASFSKKFGTK